MTDQIKKPAFKFKNRIITKSLFRVLCILLPVIGLFQYMSYSGKETELRLETERNNLEFATRVNRAGSSASLASAYLLIHLLMNSDRATAGWLKHRQAAIEETQKLESIARRVNDPVKNKFVSKMVRQTYSTFDFLSKLHPAASTMEIRSVVTNLKVLRKYFLYVFEVHNLFHTMEKDEQARLMEAIEQGKKERIAFNQILNIALVFLLAAGVALVLQFSREITSRLKIVVENATRLPQREKLNDALEGSDEISYLDSVLHQAADKLEQSALFRKNLLEMVAHDMCSPLTSVNLSLAILQSGGAETVSESSAEKFSQAGSKIEQLVLNANSLLSIERLCANSPDLAFGDVEMPRKKSEKREGEACDDKNINELSRLIRIEFGSASGLGKDAAKRFRPGVFRKGLVLVLLPLMFSSIMILCLSQLNQRAADFLDVELKQSKVAVAINRLMISMVAHMAVVGNYQMYGDAKTGDLQIPVTEMSGKYAQELLALVDDDPLTVKDVNELTELDRRENARLEREKPVVTDYRSLPTPAFAVPGKAIMIYSIKKMERIQHITDRQIERMAATRNSEAELQKQIGACLQVGIYGSFIIAIILVCAFNSDITRRLKVLTANAELLPHRTPLKETVKGRDEIWYLDFVLHEVAEILDATWQQRKLMMEMLAADLRQPLHDTKVLLSQVPPEEASRLDDLRKRHFNFATSNIDRVLSLVEALLTIENLEQGKIELVKSQFAAREAAQEAITSLTALAQARKVSLVNDCTEAQVIADKGRVIQVIVNFLGNAINHSPEDSAVRIDTSQAPRGVRFDVIDSGPGLNREMRSKVFERFFQTADSKTKDKGYGLGLAICRMIVEAHDGSVGCDEAATGGCSFYAVFPNTET